MVVFVEKKKIWRDEFIGTVYETLHRMPFFPPPPEVEDEPNKISDPDRTTIKANIVNLMLSSPEQIQKQVC